jgi:hypothetical protein
MIKVWKCRDIVKSGRIIKPELNCEEYFNTKWVNVDELLNDELSEEINENMQYRRVCKETLCKRLLQ